MANNRFCIGMHSVAPYQQGFCPILPIKGIKCQAYKILRKIQDEKRRNLRKQRFDNGEDICPQCGKEAPGIHDLPNTQGLRPICIQYCRKSARVGVPKAEAKRLKLEREEINQETHKICNRCKSCCSEGEVCEV